MLSIFTQGFLLQASLILVLGAQNIFVLNSGLRRQRHLLVAAVCSMCDTLLVFAGVLGVATVFARIPALQIGLGITGVVFLVFYGFLKLKEAKEGIELAQISYRATTAGQTILTTLGFSLLNPHVYLDTVVLIGGYSTKFALLSERFYFGMGASTFSLLWFFGLALLASLGSNLLNNKSAMRALSLLSGLILIALGIKLGRALVDGMTVPLAPEASAPYQAVRTHRNAIMHEMEKLLDKKLNRTEAWMGGDGTTAGFSMQP